MKYGNYEMIVEICLKVTGEMVRYNDTRAIPIVMSCGIIA